MVPNVTIMILNAVFGHRFRTQPRLLVSLILVIALFAMTAALCRLCAEETPDTVNIFSGRGAELGLAEKISKCLPVVVSSAHCAVSVSETEVVVTKWPIFSLTL